MQFSAVASQGRIGWTQMQTNYLCCGVSVLVWAAAEFNSAPSAACVGHSAQNGLDKGVCDYGHMHVQGDTLPYQPQEEGSMQ